MHWPTLFTFTLSFLAHRATAHGGCLNYTVGDATYPGSYTPSDDPSSQDPAPWTVQRKWTSIDPIFDPMNISMPCNAPGTPAALSIPLDPNSVLTALYTPWIHTVGPMTVFMAACPSSNCTTAFPSALSWFKIAERGLLSGTIETGTWFQGQFSPWDGSPAAWSERIPAGLRPGAYLVRHEIVSLHVARRPQFYAQCVHVEVGGVGVGEPGEEYLTRIPGVWSLEQPEINIDIYAPGISNSTTYNIPGPPVWTGV